MSKSNYALFIIPALIWGSTWYVITYQLGVVDPLVSVSYRFGIAGLMLLGYAKLKKLPLKYSQEQHLFIALQGLLLFGVNYWFVYVSETYLSSGLVAVAFSTLIFLNIFFGAIFLGNIVKGRVILGAVAGLCGTVLIYQSEFNKLDLAHDQVKGLLFCIGSIVFASLGNITSAYNQRKYKLPVIQTNAFGMIYGSIIMLGIAIATGKTINFDASLSYVLSLGYLALFGSVIAFTGYLTLIGRIGADKAAYTIVFVPVIALTISTFYEGYEPDNYAYLGIGLILSGNVLALRSKKPS
jgi:drug/metabolite transporter (DMT)-like permease